MSIKSLSVFKIVICTHLYQMRGEKEKEEEEKLNSREVQVVHVSSVFTVRRGSTGVLATILHRINSQTMY